jgi:hypothetical protein
VGEQDVFIAKFNSDLTSLLAATYLGGTSGDYDPALALDSSGDVVISLDTVSSDFPTTVGAYDRIYSAVAGEPDIAVSMLDADLETLMASTYLGGTDYEVNLGNLLIDAEDRIIVNGITRSANFPTTSGTISETIDTGYDWFITIFNNNLQALHSSSFIGGNADDLEPSIALAPNGDLYFGGSTESTDLPVSSGGMGYEDQNDLWIGVTDHTLADISYSTYLGGSDSEFFASGKTMAFDSSGNVYVFSETRSTDFPVTSGIIQASSGGGDDLAVSKFNPTLSSLLASTYIGGTANEDAAAIFVDTDEGEVILVGYTLSSNYPTTVGTYSQYTFGGSDLVITKLNLSLSTMIASTYIGGSLGDFSWDAVLAPSGHIFVLGSTRSADFPVPTDGFDPTFHGESNVAILKIDGDLTEVTAGTYLVPESHDELGALAINSVGEVVVAGTTAATYLPYLSGSYNSDPDPGEGPNNIFVAKFNAALTQLNGIALIGGSHSEQARALVIDSSDNIYVLGTSRESTSDAYPTTIGASTPPGGYDIVVSKFNSALTSLIASTYLGGTGNDYVSDATIVTSGDICLVGSTEGTDYPYTAGAIYTSSRGGVDGVVTCLPPDLDDAESSTYMGGSSGDELFSIASDASGDIYVAGYSTSTNLAVTAGAYDQTHNGNTDIFVAALNSSLTSITALTYVGGSDFDTPYDLFLPPTGSVYLTGNTGSSDFPASTSNATSSNLDAFAIKLNSSLTSLDESIVFGGADTDTGNSIQVDSLGNVFIGGYTFSTDFPAVAGNFDSTFNTSGFDDGFITRIDSSFNIVDSTYLGGEGGDSISKILLDDDTLYVAGNSTSIDFPTTLNSYDRVNPTDNDNNDLFVSIIDTGLQEAVAPIISHVTASTANGSYNAGDDILIEVHFSENVTVTGTPRLRMDVSIMSVYANYTSGSGSSILVFTYSINNGDNSADLDYAATSQFSMSGATIKDGAGNSADLTLPDPGAIDSLGYNKDIVIDTAQPSVVLATSGPNPTNSTTIPVTITFSEPVTGFDVSDISVTNGSAGNFAYSAGVYTADITPTAHGAVIVNVPAEVALDGAANLNTAAAALVVTYDDFEPFVVIGSTAPNPTNYFPITLNIRFSENVTGFELEDIAVGNGTAGNFSGSGRVYSADITPTTDGAVTVDIADGVATDSAGNANTAATTFTRTYDTLGPTPTITSSAGATTNISPIPVTITFSEAVIGFAVGDITVGNGSAGNFSGSGTTYTADITPDGDGTVAIDITGFVAVDQAGNSSSPATGITRIYDTLGPIVSMSSTSSATTNENPFTVSIEFSEPVTGFDISDLSVSNATLDSFSGSGGTYSVDVLPSTDGPVTVNISSGVANDSGGNGNTAASEFSRTFDSGGPTVSITSSAASVTNTSPIPVTITFSESVTGFAVGDISVSNGSAGNFSGSGTTYTADITPNADGAVTVNVFSAVATDAAGNSNSSAPELSRTYDSTGSTVLISSSAASVTNSSPIPVTITFSESVTGFVVGDISVTNGSAGNFSGSGTTYTADITPTTEGSVTINVNSAVAVDTAGNSNSSAPELSRTYDSTGPTVLIGSTAASVTNTSPIPITITFSEAVTGFAVGDISVSNGSAGNFAGSGTTYTADITPSTDGAVSINVNGAVAVDTAGNGNSAASELSRTYDSTAPTASISSSTASVTNSSPIPVTITFSESVTGFAVGDISVTNGSAGNFAGSGTTYTADITPSTDGAVTVNVNSAAAVDIAGNSNSAAPELSRTYDSTGPTVSIGSTAATVTNTSPIPVTITFSEVVTGFAVGDISVTNGSAGNFAGSGTTYTADITPTTQGAVSINVNSSVAVDTAGNSNSAASELNRTYDSIAPTVAISSSTASVTNSSPIPITITFSEVVTGFAVSDISVSNGSAGNFAGSGTTYTADITPNADGAVTINVNSAVATDAAGSSNSAAPELSRTYDSTGPTVSISSSAANVTNASPIPVTITFSESVTGFVVGDISVTNGSAGNFAGSGTTYTADITPSADGSVTINVNSAIAADTAGNSNSAATQLSRTYDSTAPTVSISSSTASITNSSPIPVTITFSEAVTGFAVGDISVTNGAAGNFAGSGTTYTADITPSGDGAVTINVNGSVATDTAGNSNSAASELSRTYDQTIPSVSISSSAPSDTNSSPIPVTITFSEAVTGFVVGDITVTNGSAGNFAGSGTTYTADITPSANGAVSVNVASSVAVDLAGNANTAASAVTRVYDTTAPTVLMTSSTSSTTNVSPFALNIVFSESVTGFSISDLVVSNGTLSNFSGSGSTYSVDITPATDWLVTVNIAGEAASDSAGNGNTVAAQFSRTFDSTSPSVTISSSAASVINTPAIPVTITFSEGVTGFTVGDISVANGTAGSFSGSGNSYSASITPTTDGTVSVSISGGVAFDIASNGNTAASGLSRVYDSTPPTVTISSSVSDPTASGSIPVTFSFSESVTGFSLGDISVVNGTAGNLSGSGATYSADVTAAAAGTVTISVNGSVVTDSAGNSNSAAAPLSRSYVPPTPTPTPAPTATPTPTPSPTATPTPTPTTPRFTTIGTLKGKIKKSRVPTVTQVNTESAFSIRVCFDASNIKPSKKGEKLTFTGVIARKGVKQTQRIKIPAKAETCGLITPPTAGQYDLYFTQRSSLNKDVLKSKGVTIQIE